MCNKESRAEGTAFAFTTRSDSIPEDDIARAYSLSLFTWSIHSSLYLTAEAGHEMV
jgi:hypothetical protein